MRTGRRAFLASAVGTTVLSSGCLGFVLGGEPLSFEASPAEVSSSALSGTGFEHVGTEPVTLSETFEVAGQSRTVELTNYVSRYAKSVELGGEAVRGAAFGSLATPLFDLAGQSIDPVEGIQTGELARRAQDVYADLSVREQVGSVAREVLGQPRDLLRYALAATLGGRDVEALLHLADFRDAGDALVLAGVNPRVLDAETRNVLALAEGITHATEGG
jgi:hypothetical protein